MSSKSQIAVAQALADETRLDILHRLMEGPAAVSELVAESEKSQSLVSNHLAVLKASNLVAFEKDGRKSVYRLTNASVATLVESLTALSRNGSESRPTPALASARTCYDHLAGSLGVEIYDWLIKRKAIVMDGDDVGVGPKGHEIFSKLGVDIDQATKSRRRFAIACLDWTEKKAHLGGSLGANLCAEFIARGWITRQTGTRAVQLTPSGKRKLNALMR
jgi:DNA-binding transcriptional ArsR family regulator